MVDSEAPAFVIVPARRRTDSAGRLEMPASLNDELALRDLPDLDETLFVWDGSKRRENMLIREREHRKFGQVCLFACCLCPNSARSPGGVVDLDWDYGAGIFGFVVS